MINCGHIRERINPDGTIAVSPCWIWTDCPHQEVYEFQVWQYSTRGDCPAMIGRFDNRIKAKLFELKQDAEQWIDIRRVKL